MLHHLSLRQFRNYTAQQLDFAPGVNLLCGGNGQGKTNLLESVYYASHLRSFRTAHVRELIGHDAPACRVELDFTAGERPRHMDIILPRKGRVQVKVNGVSQPSLSKAQGLLYTVLFAPEDVSLVREGPARRRQFLDAAISQLRPRYGTLLQEYQRVLLHKSRILRDQNPSFLPLWEDYSARLCRLGARLLAYRRWFVSELFPLAAAYHGQIAPGEELTLRYRPQIADDGTGDAAQLEQALWQHMREHYAAELASKSCLSGVQRDEMEVEIDGRPARLYASQGQSRTAALALKLAERQLIVRQCGQMPVLLLDDVLSELDEGRQRFVLGQIDGGQSIITCCDGAAAQRLCGGRMFEVEQGQAREV